jgi:hypothetical protein
MKKFIEKLMRVKENIKIDKSLYIDFWKHFFNLTNITLRTLNSDLTPRQNKPSSEVEGDLSISPIFDFEKEAFDETIIGKATRESMEKFVKELGKKFD